jgi:hypothetical protein
MRKDIFSPSQKPLIAGKMDNMGRYEVLQCKKKSR